MTRKLLYLAVVAAFLPIQFGYSEEPIKHINFDALAEGQYTSAILEQQWSDIEWSTLYDRGWIVSDPNISGRKVLRVSYPKGSLGSQQGGIQFVARLKPSNEYWLSYYVKFEKGFDFRLGGKLPGLAGGGSKWTGGHIPKNGEGWSARYMWKKDGKAIIYLYYVDMPGKWGENLALDDAVFVPGKWHNLVQHIKVNESNDANGVLEVWFDGKKVLSRSDIRFRLGGKGLIDSFLFSTFHGGNTPDWAPDVNSFTCFDEFVISKQRPAVLKDINMEYTIKKTIGTVSLNSKWDEAQWAKANILELKNYMGQKPEHFPKTQAKLLYDSNNIYVFFRVEDNYIKAVAEKTQDMVCRDSCAEFFFTPGEDILKGYFNVEINCGGTMLIYHQTARGENKIEIPEQDCRKIEICASMPKKVEPEIRKPTVWTLQYSVPFEVLEKYTTVTRPNTGVKWRANFYKCGDRTSHPHWLTWSLVNELKPDFHQPRYFGTLRFE